MPKGLERVARMKKGIKGAEKGRGRMPEGVLQQGCLHRLAAASDAMAGRMSGIAIGGTMVIMEPMIGIGEGRTGGSALRENTIVATTGTGTGTGSVDANVTTGSVAEIVIALDAMLPAAVGVAERAEVGET